MKKYKRELIIESKFVGRIVYSCDGMRYQDEEERYYLNKGDRVYIYRLSKGEHR